MKLKQVENFPISRFLQSPSFGRIIDVCIHFFFHASEHGCRQCSYIRYANEDGLIHWILFLEKSRVSPKKKIISIPRLELIAAVLSVKVACLLKKELQIDGLKERPFTSGIH